MKVLLTTVHQPLGVENDTCTPNIQAEMYHAQVTRAQGLFSIRSLCTGWGLEFIAANIDAPTTVLHYPTRKQFLRELRKGYDYVGIGFVICTFPKAVEMCGWIRAAAPNVKIILGGYGTVLPECDQYADYVCREEGVGFMRRLLGEMPREHFTIPPLQRTLSVMSVTTRPENIVPAGLGCSRGCDFCCTSHFFHQRTVPLLKTGDEIHAAMMAVKPGKYGLRNIGVVDEDFLADKRRIMPLVELNAAVRDGPILFYCLTSLRSLMQYTTEELLKMGLSGVWVGIESQQATYAKLRGIDARALLAGLQAVGINTLNSMIIGYDWHDEESIEADFQYLLSLKPAFTQLMIYSPCPQTPLFRRFQEEDRLLRVPYKYHDGFHALFKHPKLTSARLESLVVELFRREYEELGPSVCRVLDIQLQGFCALRNHESAALRRRAADCRNLSLEIYPILRTAIRHAPSDRVAQWLKELKQRAEAAFEIPLSASARAYGVPVLAAYSRVRERLWPNPQPHVRPSRYRSSSMAAF